MFLFFGFITSKQYKTDEEIRVYGNKITPYNNPFESYQFYSIPFCQPNTSSKPIPTTFGDAFLGNKYVKTAVTIRFRNDQFDARQCKMNITDENFAKFEHAIRNHYIFQIFVDKLPVWGQIGTTSKDNSTHLFTKWQFNIGYNGNRVTEADVTPSVPVNITRDRTNISFTYSVSWFETSVGKRDRYNKYVQNSVGNSVHYASLFNIIIIVILIVGISVCILLRALGKDISIYESNAVMNQYEMDFRIERGWKMIHADVFRKPPLESLIAAFVGFGSHMLITGILFTLFNFLFGRLLGKSMKLNLLFISFAISGFFSGYFSAGLYKRWGGNHWIFHLLMSTFIFPTVFAVNETILSVFAAIYGSTQIYRVKSLIIIICNILFLVLPLTLAGGIVGRHWFIVGKTPTQVSLIRRKIPDQPFYLSLLFLMVVIGFIGSISIFVELPYILTAFLQYNFTYAWGFMFIVVILLFIVISCCSIISTYLRLANENYEWQWPSFLAPFATGVYCFFYCIYYMKKKTMMSGVIQILFFISYSVDFSLAVGFVCGFVGFASSAIFVRMMYTNLKID
ncbi:endomembrane protein 70, putative [Trichomonas vaginalis G3]|uniref:Transmembrane 9 superfamily member n=1 Tax=Trichomonas vaginalis (strain ATCC PRA-98 / G3) TaxID=412133 RepID=A2EWA2_TRIV3|nr:transmembrane 9 superfamily member 3 family [Trichomonas vaginalis G3]EAY03079.1 endomembrane protein 70, putative [Trichomonas vaginalis G3]KAI5484808.1 transmembrane 9 superfamily member 3 family [Trichomonas vaginalis G3]|eukprot:XP_001315302.1 endomembrane protein 70 [Trichomonas vaginalis G3]